MSSRANRWLAPVTGAVAGLLVAAAVVGPSALASGGGATTPPSAAKAANPGDPGNPGNSANPGNPGNPGNPAKAANPGNPGKSAKAAKAAKAANPGNPANAANAAKAAKLAAASAAGCPGPVASAEGKQPGGHSAGPSPAPFLAAVARLVQAGTIDQAQARVLDADIRAGSIDSDQLVARGTLSSAQMQAVNDRLVAIKRSMASKASP